MTPKGRALALAGAWVATMGLGASDLHAAETWEEAIRADRMRQALVKEAKYREALPYAQRAVALVRKLKGENDLNYAVSLGNLAWLHEALGQYEKAAPLYEKAVAAKKQLLGADHLSTATTLNNLAGVYLARGKHARALPLYTEVLRVFNKRLGQEHPNVAVAMSNLARVHQSMAKYGQALPLYRQAAAIFAKRFGDEDPRVATGLANLGVLYRDMGQLHKALPLLTRALAIDRKAHGHDHPAVAVTLANLAALWCDLGEHAKALPLLKEALNIHREARGEDHPHVATCLINLAALHAATGENAKALPRFTQALAILTRKFGDAHPQVANTLNSLGAVHWSMGQYGTALPLFRQALALRRKLLGEDHPDVARTLANLAALYHSIGEYAKALPLYTQALEMRRRRLGDEHPEVALSLNNLAELHRAMGHPAKAIPLLAQALAMRRKLLGDEHPDVAQSLNNLAEARWAVGDHAQALPLCTQALAIFTKRFGQEHPAVATSLHNLAGLYEAMGQPRKAMDLHQRALAMRQRLLGEDHPDVAATLTHVAGLAVELGRAEEAWGPARRARAILLRARARAAPTAVSRSAFLAGRAWPGLLASLAVKLHKGTDALELLEQERSLALRELLAQARAQTSARLAEADRRRLAAALGRINALNTQIENRARRKLPLDAVRQQLLRAEMDYEATMAGLSKRYEHFVATHTARAITSQQAAKSAALDDQTAIVGWAGYFKWLWAYVIRNSGTQWVDLATGYRRADEAKRARRIISAAHGAATARPPAADLATFYRKHFGPLEPHLKGVSKLIVIAEDWTAFLPLEILLTREPPAKDHDLATWPWLGDQYKISYAPSVTALDILCRKRQRRAATWERPLFALGDPPFSPEQLAQMQAEKHPPIRIAQATGGDTDMSLNRALRFDKHSAPPRLPGTRREVELLARLFGADKSLLLLGPAATERKLFEANARGDLSRCRYIHLATHGLADSQRPELSALVLARVPEDDDYDGVLHMREVFHLKLEADLVVLSACQTGLGKHLGGDGVVGLSTAFFFAGTPSVVLSLWNVPDSATTLLMHRFYSNLKAGHTKAAALCDAKKWLRNLTRDDIQQLSQGESLVGHLARGIGGALRSPKGRLLGTKPFAHPHYWAGFVLTGDPR